MRNVLAAIALLFVFSAGAQTPGHKIEIKIRGLKDTFCLLANYYGDKQYVKDTGWVDSKGYMVFQKKEKLPQGIYMLVLPKHTYFEIAIPEDDQEFYLENDTNLTAPGMIVKGSRENEVFYEYNTFVANIGEEANIVRKKYDEEKNEAKKEELKNTLMGFETKVKSKRSELAAANPNLFITKVFRAMMDVEIPEPPTNPDGSYDSSFKFRYYQEHFWDNIDLSDDGMVRTPIYHGKLVQYMTKTHIQLADSVILAADRLISKIEKAGSKELFKYSVWWITNHYEESKIVCMDKVLWHMATKYYCAGKCWWADSAMVAKMCDHAKKIEPTLCDKIAPNMTLIDSSLRAHTLHNYKNPIKVVIFWDVHCGHCQKQLPELQKIYEQELKAKNVLVYAVYTQDDWDGWKKFIRDNKLSFLNVGNLFGQSQYRKDYFFIATPEVLVLDAENRIRFKKISVEALPKIVDFLLNEDKEGQD